MKCEVSQCSVKTHSGYDAENDCSVPRTNCTVSSTRDFDRDRQTHESLRQFDDEVEMSLMYTTLSTISYSYLKRSKAHTIPSAQPKMR